MAADSEAANAVVAKRDVIAPVAAVSANMVAPVAASAANAPVDAEKLETDAAVADSCTKEPVPASSVLMLPVDAASEEVVALSDWSTEM